MYSLGLSTQCTHVKNTRMFMAGENSVSRFSDRLQPEGSPALSATCLVAGKGSP